MLFETVSGEVGPSHELLDEIIPGAEGLDLGDPFHLEMGNIKAAQQKKKEGSEEAKKNRIALLHLKADYLNAYRQDTAMGSRRFQAVLREAQIISNELNGLENTRTNLNIYQDFIEKESPEKAAFLEGEYIPAEKAKTSI